MRLKNKQTGSIGTLEVCDDHFSVWQENGCNSYDSLEKLSEEWEECEEEPGEITRYWYIGYKNDIKVCYNHNDRYVDTDVTKQREAIGNRFETFEEAKEALEKLKAWKRLKDRGFRFTGFDSYAIGYDIKNLSDGFSKDLNLLFGDRDE